MSFQYLNQFKPQYNKNGRLNDLIIDQVVNKKILQYHV